MREDASNLLDAALEIGGFADEFGIAPAKFEALKTYDPRFRTLNGRRLRAWILRSKSSLPCSKANAQTQAMLRELARLIREEKDHLLELLGIPRRPSKAGGQHRAEPEPCGVRLGEFQTPEQLCDFAIVHASCGYHQGALASLMAAIQRAIPSDLHRVAILLPTTIYILNRYCTPHQLASTIQQIHSLLEPHQLKYQIAPELLNVTLSQLASAFTDRASPEAAEELLFKPELREMMESEHESPWLTPQLLRTCSMYWGVFGHRPESAMKYATKAQEAAHGDQMNDNRIAHVLFTVYLSMSSPDNKKAWEAMEPHYEKSRQILIDAANTNAFSVNGIVLLHANVYCGSAARLLSGKGYPNRSELTEDMKALEWVEGIYGRVSVANQSVKFASNRFSPEIAQLYQRSFRTALTPWQTSILWEFQKLLSSSIRGK